MFGHGQLYVALSRCRHHEHVKVHIRDNPEHGRMLPNDIQKYFMKNVVIKQLLLLKKKNLNNAGYTTEAKWTLSQLASRLSTKQNCPKFVAIVTLYGKLNLTLGRANIMAFQDH